MKPKFYLATILHDKCFTIFPTIIVDWEDYLTIGFAWLFWCFQLNFK